jgi:signal transduction histidine kinase
MVPVMLPPFAMMALLVFIGEFCIYFLDTRHHTPWLTRLLRVMQGVVVVNASLVLAFDSSINAMLEPIIVMAFVGLLIFTAIIRTMQHDTAARIFLIANGIMGIAAATVALIHLGIVEDSPFGRQAALTGSAIEIALLSLALAWRLRRREHQQHLLKERSLGLARRVKELQAATGLAEEHRQLQRSMQQAQKLKTIGQMAGGIAHDFNNILATIMGFAELAREKSAAKDRDKQARYLEEIHQAGERGAALVKQLLTYSRGATKEAREIDLNKTIGEAGNLLRGSLPTTVSIKTHLPDHAIQTVLDPAQLQQVLVNLALNASESMQDRGEIDISLDRLDVDNLQCSSCLTRFGGDFVRIKVQDTGQGFEGNAHELFTPFFTSKPVGQGSGLGLSVVHGIVHEHRGHVQISNRSQGGTRFSIYLPINSISHTAEIVGQRILLIEDDASVGRYLETLLGEHAYDVTSVSLPTKALEQFMAHPNSFDLVITDQVMPHGTGLELAQDMHELRPDLPVIITTGNPTKINPDEMARAGIKAVFGKPIESELLLAKVRGLLSANG